MYWTEIIYLITWPVLIFISYCVILFALKKFEARQEKHD